MSKAVRGLLIGFIIGILSTVLFGPLLGGLPAHPIVTAILSLFYWPAFLTGSAIIFITGQAAGHIPNGIFILAFSQLFTYPLLGFLIGRYLDKNKK